MRDREFIEERGGGVDEREEGCERRQRTKRVV